MSVLKAYCSICNLWLNSQEQLIAHQAGKSHRRRETFGENNIDHTRSLVSQENISAPTQNSSQNDGEKSKTKQGDAGGQNDGSRTKTENGSEYLCDSCMVTLTSKSQADMHFGGAKHKKVLAVLAGKHEVLHYTEGKGDGVCDICNVPLPSKAVAEAHYAGSKHERKLKLSQSLEGSVRTVYSSDKRHPSTGPTSLPVTANIHYQMGQASSIQMIPVAPGSVSQQTRGLISDYFYCTFCSVRVNSRQQMEAHWQGTKHKNNVNGHIAQPKKSFTQRPAINHGRYVNPGHIYSPGNCGSSNGPIAYRPVRPLPYASRQF